MFSERGKLTFRVLFTLHLIRAWCLHLCECLVKMFRMYPRVYQGELKFLCQPKGLILEKIQTLLFMGSEITKHKKKVLIMKHFS